MLSKDGLEMETATKQKKGRSCPECIACSEHSWDRAVEQKVYVEGMDNRPIPVMSWETSVSSIRLIFFTASVPKREA